MDFDDVDLDAAQRVERTGLALVHEGELVVPAPGAEAQLAPPDFAVGGGSAEVHYWFPVQIEVVGLDEQTAGGVVQRVFDELQQELESWG